MYLLTLNLIHLITLLLVFSFCSLQVDELEETVMGRKQDSTELVSDTIQ